MKYFVEIVKYEREETVVKHMGPMGRHKAIRVNNGANRNLVITSQESWTRTE